MEIMQEDDKTDYKHVINYLISSMRKNNIENNNEAASNNDYITNKLINETKPVFLYEFVVFELYIPKEILRNLKQPLLAFRLLHFPTQTIEGKIDLNKES